MAYKVLLVDDSRVALFVLKKMLSYSPEIEVVGTAQSGQEALELIPLCQPDVICTDLHMENINGEELTKIIMERDPRPILVISSSVQNEDKTNLFRLLEAGAIDFFAKPKAGLNPNNTELVQKLIRKIKILSGVVPIRKRLTTRQLSPIQNAPNNKIIIIGASTGGPVAIKSILSQLPQNFPAAIICIQHISKGFLQGFIDWLSTSCKLPIKTMKIGEKPQSGNVYFPLEGHHLQLSKDGTFYSNKGSLENEHCPSISKAFQSAAQHYKKNTIAVLLTGMGDDGASGLKKVQLLGGVTIAQNEESCIVFGMPQEAIKIGAAQHIVPLKEIPVILSNLIDK
ncbi:chemotaxis-specific protein-glutamate methyltransferase CheB [Candidatus Uabimicrobium sp. HlEnr_7]|uniref:chemotaxis-specific protein-glutamate methyltransferase CheB n=1 Tax=Candidatus Uabimicrobium helgolandensis TaxID=3095367 RepID=UPI0035571DDE